MQLYYPTSTDVEEEALSVCPEGKIETNASQTGMEPIIPCNNAIYEEERSFALHLFSVFGGERFLFPFFLSQSTIMLFHYPLLPVLIQ